MRLDRWFAAIAVRAIAPTAGAAESAAQAAAQAPVRDVTDLLLRVNGPVHLVWNDSAASVWVVSSDAVIDGTVREQLMVVDGTARVSGTVRGGVVVANGHLELAPTACVAGDVVLFRSTLGRAAGASVRGTIHQETGVSFVARAAWLFWLGTTVLALAVALAVAALARRQLAEGAGLIAAEPGHTLVAALVLWIGLPVLAMLSFASVIGIPLGFVVVLFVIPVLTLIGYAVTGTALGAATLRAMRRRRPEMADGADRRYAPAVLGIVMLQLLALVPGAGGLILILAGLAGAGALLYRARIGRRRVDAAMQLTLPLAVHEGRRAMRAEIRR